MKTSDTKVAQSRDIHTKKRQSRNESLAVARRRKLSKIEISTRRKRQSRNESLAVYDKTLLLGLNVHEQKKGRRRTNLWYALTITIETTNPTYLTTDQTIDEITCANHERRRTRFKWPTSDIKRTNINWKRVLFLFPEWRIWYDCILLRTCMFLSQRVTTARSQKKGNDTR